ncbi:MAG: hypothetical protein KJ578_00820 [Bacteroidetes bacterium]|nr:hypothetical protein [Bacteroidota bacterium]MBU2556303.1 hypothetical protein [Bacteroidota bacterium]
MQIGPVGIHDVSKKKEIWNDFAKLYSGNLKVIKTKSKEFERLQLTFEFQGASIVFIETDTKPLRVEIELPNSKCDSKFLLSESDFMDKALSFFSSKKVTTNSDELNRNYLLKSKNEEFVKSLFNDKKIQTIILQEKIMMISGILRQTTFYIEMAVNRDINNFDKLNNIGLLTKMIIEKTYANK